jgi:hypothetical protein
MSELGERTLGDLDLSEKAPSNSKQVISFRSEREGMCCPVEETDSLSRLEPAD